MSDKDVIQKAYESSLAQVYATFVLAYTDALGDKEKEADAESRFRTGVLHVRFLRDRALALLP